MPRNSFAAAIALTVAFAQLGSAPAMSAADPTVAQTASAIPPIAPGSARVWFLRQFQPAESLQTPTIYVNGAALALSQPGTAFYRDFAPGTYTFSVDTCTVDSHQKATVNLVPGLQIDLEIQSLSSFRSWDCVTDTFYVRPIPPAWAQMYFAQLAYLGPR